MSEPIALVKSGGDGEVVAFACGRCGTVAGSPFLNGSTERAFKAAAEHCACTICGGERDRPFSTLCQACSEKRRAEQSAESDRMEAERFAKARKVSPDEVPMSAWACDPDERLGNDGYGQLDGLLEAVADTDESERPAYLWRCTSRRPFIDAKSAVESMVEQACEDHHDEAHDETVGENALLAAITPAIEAWNAAQTTHTFEVDYSTAIVLGATAEDAVDEDGKAVA